MDLKEKKERALASLRATYNSRVESKTENKTKTVFKEGVPPANNKDLILAAENVSLKAEIFHLKLDLLSLYNIMLDRQLDAEIERKDVERMYGEFRQSKEHLIGNINKKGIDYEFSKVERSFGIEEEE